MKTYLVPSSLKETVLRVGMGLFVFGMHTLYTWNNSMHIAHNKIGICTNVENLHSDTVPPTNELNVVVLYSIQPQFTSTHVFNVLDQYPHAIPKLDAVVTPETIHPKYR